MRKSIIILLVLLMASQVNAQVAHWIIHPDYDSIYFASGANLIITDSLNETIVWTPDGKRLFKTSDKLYPFEEGFAVATEKNSDKITGFYAVNGKFIPLENCSIAHDYPYFSDGYLTVKNGNSYYFANSKGELNKNGIINAYPFHHGFSSCNNTNPDRPKETYNFLINTDRQKLAFSYNGKTFSHDDLEFISSVNDEGIGIVVAKHKVYYFKGERELEPVLFATDENGDSEKQAKLDGKISKCLVELDNSDFILYMECGKSKSDEFSCRFNSRLVPLEIGPTSHRIPFQILQTTKEKQNSPLKITRKNNLFGCSINGIVILPEQFEAIYDCFGHKAFVKTSGKQGLIHIVEDKKFEPQLNERNAIGFRHQTFNTTLRLDMPSYIPSETTYIESLDPNCSIDQISREFKNTPRGNSIQYTKGCTLNFPDNLDENMTEITYPFQIVSDGIRFPVFELITNAWHYKYITIQVNESGKAINKGKVTFTFDLIAERFPGDDVYPFTVNIVTDSLYSECEALSSTRYKCTIFDLKEGLNEITIEVLENGCSPISTGFNLTYNKPSSKNKHKESVNIKKKTEEQQWRF
jgi:hypothetical protein